MGKAYFSNVGENFLSKKTYDWNNKANFNCILKLWTTKKIRNSVKNFIRFCIKQWCIKLSLGFFYYKMNIKLFALMLKCSGSCGMMEMNKKKINMLSSWFSRLICFSFVSGSNKSIFMIFWWCLEVWWPHFFMVMVMDELVKFLGGFGNVRNYNGINHELIYLRSLLWHQKR